MEYKRFSVRFVLATLVVTNTHVALADVLPPPPPPPPQAPGTNPTPAPSVPTGSGVLDAPPPPPPGVNIEIAPTVPTTKTSSTPIRPPTASTVEPMPSVLTPPPKPPPGVRVDGPEPEPARVPLPHPQTSNPQPTSNTLPAFQPKAQPRQTAPSGWYGWKSLIGLVPVYGLFIGAVVSEEETLFFPAVVGGMVVTPIAHWTHGNRRTGWLSFGLNIGSMAIGGMVGDGEGAAFALAIWNIIDIAGFHHKQEPTRPPTAATSALQSIAIVPMMDHGRKGFTLMGQF